MRLAAFIGMAAAAVLLWMPTPQAAAQDASLSQAVKATYLYKLAPFIDWPPGAFPSPDSAFRICVAGDPGFGELVRRAVGDQRLGPRPVVVNVIERVPDDGSCHIVYVSDAAPRRVADGLAELRGKPVLTVTDEERGTRAAGIVHFVVRQGRVRFAIDNGLALEGGLRISPKVLELAVEVKRGP